MPLHPELNNLTQICRKVIFLDEAQFSLSGSIGAEKNDARKMLLQLAREEIHKDLDYTVRRLRRVLNTHFQNHESALWISKENVEIKA